MKKGIGKWIWYLVLCSSTTVVLYLIQERSWDFLFDSEPEARKDKERERERERQGVSPMQFLIREH
jgi:hypothetical protein